MLRFGQSTIKVQEAELLTAVRRARSSFRSRLSPASDRGWALENAGTIRRTHASYSVQLAVFRVVVPSRIHMLIRPLKPGIPWEAAADVCQILRIT